MQLPEAATRFVEAAAGLGLVVEPVVYPAGTKTARDAAAAIGCEVGAIVKSLVFMADEEPVLVLIGGDRLVDTSKVAACLGAGNVRRAGLDEVREATGFAAGGTPPFGHAGAIRTLVDAGLAGRGELWAAAGTPTTVFPLRSEVLLEAVEAQVVDGRERSVMEAGTWEGATALVVIDVQQGFDAVSAPRNHPDCERNVAALIEAWRRQGWPVVFVRHDSEEERSPLRPDQPGNALKPEVSGEPDLLVVKSVHSAFYGAPSLHGWAREHGIAGLAICGLQTNVCCETTARMASDPRLRHVVRHRCHRHVRSAGTRRRGHHGGRTDTSDRQHARSRVLQGRNHRRPGGVRVHTRIRVTKAGR